MTTQDNQEELLPQWLLEQAEIHSASIARNDPAVQAHIKKLREWAVSTQSLQTTLASQREEIAVLKEERFKILQSLERLEDLLSKHGIKDQS